MKSKRNGIDPQKTVIKSIRESVGLTQEQFAKRLGVSERSVRRWETGEREPLLTFAQSRILVQIIEEAGLKVDDLPEELSKPQSCLVA